MPLEYVCEARAPCTKYLRSFNIELLVEDSEGARM